MFTDIRHAVRCALVVVFASFVSLSAFAQDDPCDRSPKTFELKIKVKNSMPTAVVKGFFSRSADEVHVCRGDTIVWKLSNKAFFIEFPNRSPIGTEKKRSDNGKVTTVVSVNADRGSSYKYNVGIVDGGLLDPIIIVD